MNKHNNGAELKNTKDQHGHEEKEPQNPDRERSLREIYEERKKLVRYQPMVHRKLEPKTMYKKRVGIGLGQNTKKNVMPVG